LGVGVEADELALAVPGADGSSGVVGESDHAVADTAERPALLALAPAQAVAWLEADGTGRGVAGEVIGGVPGDQLAQAGVADAELDPALAAALSADQGQVLGVLRELVLQGGVNAEVGVSRFEQGPVGEVDPEPVAGAPIPVEGDAFIPGAAAVANVTGQE